MPLTTRLAAGFAALALLIGAGPASAEEEARSFAAMGPTPDESQWGYLDTGSLDRDGETVVFWTLWVNAVGSPADRDGIGYALRLYRFDCDARTSEMMYVALYDRAYAALPGAGSPGREAAAPARWAPGTFAETLGGIICDGKPLPEATRRYTLSEALRDIRERDTGGRAI